jgi:hypothetical protein
MIGYCLLLPSPGPLQSLCLLGHSNYGAILNSDGDVISIDTEQEMV